MNVTYFRWLLLPFILVFFPVSYGFSQASGDYWELGIFGGASHYYGDLQEDIIHTEEIHPSVGAFLRYSPNKYLSVRSGVYFGQISGSDEHATVQGRRHRNLSFRSNIFEFSTVLEWNILGINFRRMGRKHNITPYVFAGAGVFRFNPQAEFNDEWINLQPLSTEGQGFSSYPDRPIYSLTQFAIPHGAGIKFQLSTLIMVALEVSPRLTFTDYLDDVSTTHIDHDILRERRGEIAVMLSDRSQELDMFDEPKSRDGRQRGNTDANDWYAFFGFTISINLTSEHCQF